MITALRYIDESGCEVVSEWLWSLNDRRRWRPHQSAFHREDSEFRAIFFRYR
jgi:hypothetical protein